MLNAAELSEIRAYNRHIMERYKSIEQYYLSAASRGETVLKQDLFCSFPGEVLAGYVRAFKRALKPLDPERAGTPAAFVRLGSAHDGGYVMADPGHNGLAYSLGIGDNADWDLSMAERGFTVYQYDGSLERPPESCAGHPSLHFHSLFISGAPGERPRHTSLRSILEKNGHTRKNSLILKMDVEGAEWGVLERARQEDLAPFRQIILELHVSALDMWRLPGHTSILRRLGRTHPVAHAHINNNGRQVYFGGEPFWPFIELCCLRRDDWEFKPGKKTYPLALDAPCNPLMPDYAPDFRSL
ncbi:MAG: FkbM family methyltransferase [Deltaproteobacteria bacterium]|jgi:hypothetical protein|nr:FkbM family methyltransferase [Deltaproteobacteria bacterium]